MKQNAVQFTYLKIKMILKIGDTKSMYKRCNIFITYRNKGLIMTSNNDLNVDCYVNSNFAGLWSYEEAQDLTCMKSRRGYVVLMGNFPVMWTSKLQTEISLPAMEVDYIAMSTTMRELIPLKRLIIAVSKAVGVKEKDTVDMLKNFWEDNEGYLKLAKLEHPRMMHRSKHYDLKYYWFRYQLVPNNITLLKNNNF